MDRPGLAELFAYARKGDTLAVVRLDRLGRSLAELLATVAALSLEEKINTSSAAGGDWAARRMKAMRFHLIALPGRVVRHARRLIVRLSAGALDLIRDVRAAILALHPGAERMIAPPLPPDLPTTPGAAGHGGVVTARPGQDSSTMQEASRPQL